MRAALLALLLASGPTGADGALAQLATQLSAEVRASGAVAPLAVTVSAPGHPGLEEAFSTLLLARLAGLGLEARLVPTGPDAEALARQRGSRALLRVRLGLGTTLAATGDVLSTWVNFFSPRDVRGPGPAAVVFAEVPPDDAVRALWQSPVAQGLVLEPVPLARWPVRTAALATGALGGATGVTLAVLTEEAVEVRAADGHLLARRPLAGLPVAEAPSREAFGTLCLCDGLLYAFSARRAQGEVLALEDGALRVRAPLDHPVVACGSPPLEATFRPGAARLLPLGAAGPDALPPQAPFAWGFLRRQGPHGPAWLLLLEDGTARTGGTGPGRSFPGVGAGAALLEADGTLHLAASSASALPVVDRLVLLSAEDGTERASVEVPGRILQVTPAALKAGAPEALLLGVWGPDSGAELRLVRARP